MSSSCSSIISSENWELRKSESVITIDKAISSDVISITETISSDTTTLAASLSSVQLTSSSSSSNMQNTTSENNSNIVLSDYKLNFCSSNSSLTTSFYEMNQVIDLTKNEYFTKTSLNSPNKLTELFINTDDQQQQQHQLRRSLRLSHLYNKKQNEKSSDTSTIILDSSETDIIDCTTIELSELEFENDERNSFNQDYLHCDAKNDILLSSNASLSIDTSENNFHHSTATTSTTSTTNGGEFLNIDLMNQQNYMLNSGYYRPTPPSEHILNDVLLEKNYGCCFENELLLQQHHHACSDRIHQYSLLSTTTNDDQFSSLINDRAYLHENSVGSIDNNGLNGNTKHDVSIGTDLSISRDIRFKKDFHAIEHLKMKRPNEKESFKLVEKVQPKKSRTKYSKDQIEVLENAYSRNPYPDVITVEQLCKTLEISREKVNIWFQNRRARTKRNNKIMQDGNSMNTYNTNSRSNGYTKLYQTFQQPSQVIYNISNTQNGFYTTSTTTQHAYIQQQRPTINNGYPTYTTNSPNGSYCLNSNNFTTFNNLPAIDTITATTTPLSNNYDTTIQLN